MAERPYRGKRALDLVLLLLVAVPAILIGIPCGLAVALTSPGGAFFRQDRVGMNGRTISVWKFRTMVAGDNPIFPDASRITTVGKVLRRADGDVVGGQRMAHCGSSTRRCTKIPGVTMVSGGTASTNLRTSASVVVAAVAMIGLKLRAVIA